MNEDSTGQSLPIEPQEHSDPAPADQNEESEIEALRGQAEENWAKYLRAVAELDNLRKRNTRELENARKFGAERLAAGILPVRDSLEAALMAADTVDAASPDVAAIIEGERATLRLLDQALEGAGVKELDPVGEPFDPNKHEAISMLPSATAEPSSIVQVVQKGYEIHDRLIRPARVIVAREP
jgi:molecular chaperone GrpE